MSTCVFLIQLTRCSTTHALHPHAAATYTVQESVGVAVELSSAMLLTRKSLEAVGSLEPKEWTGAMENGE